MPVSWMFDFGDTTSAALAALTNPDIDAEIAAAKSAAVSLINSGAYGSTSGTYRVVVRQDAVDPAGYTVEIRGPIT